MKCVITDERISPACASALMARGFQLMRLPSSDKLSSAVCAHPDMLLFLHSGELFSSAEYCDRAPCFFTDIHELFPDLKITFTSDIQGARYPEDVPFNILTLGKRAFLRQASASGAVTEFLVREGYEIINVKQGYPACTVLPVGENAAITADKGMARVLSACNINVTLIENGDISLPPHEYGFIGGCAGCFEREIFFLGDYRTHRSAELIERAIRSEGYTPVSLSDEPLCDLGRIMFISR